MNSLLKEQVVANRQKEDDHIQDGHTRDFYIEGASFRTLSINGSPNISYQSSVICPHVVMPYVLEGEMNIDYLDSDSSVKITSSQNRLIFQPEFHIKVKYTGNQSFRGMRLSLDETYLTRYQSLIEQYIPGLANGLSSGKTFISHINTCNTSMSEWQALNDVANCPFTGDLRDMYLESKVGELLALRFSGFSRQSVNAKRRLKSTDYCKIKSVRAFLENSFDQKHSLNSLAKEFGLNTFKLKVGFRELYHVPVYQFILSLRMKKAKELLQDGMNVNEVSHRLGYAQANYFSMAFKKHYGFAPSLFKIR